MLQTMLRRLLCVFLLVGCASKIPHGSDESISAPPTLVELDATNIEGVPASTLVVEEATMATSPAPTTTVDLVALEYKISSEREVHGKCGEYHDLAIQVGWPEEEWSTLSYVMWRESRCDPQAWNQKDPGSGSRSILQINSFWCDPSKWSTDGWLQDRGIVSSCDDLFNVETSLRAGLAIWMYGEIKHGCGWRGPWATSCN